MAFRSISLFLVSQLLLHFLNTDAKVPAIIVFGDSSVDSGNNNYIPTLLRSNFKPYGRDFSGGKATGRFSNGRVPTDFISEAFGLKGIIPAYLDPAYSIKDFATGVCFASAGTGYDNITSQVLVSICSTSIYLYWCLRNHSNNGPSTDKSSFHNFSFIETQQFLLQAFEMTFRSFSYRY